MKFINIKQLIIKFMGGGIINFPTRFLRWVKIEGDTDGSDDGGGDSGGGGDDTPFVIRFKTENFPLDDTNVLTNAVDRNKGYTLDEIFEMSDNTFQNLIDLWKANANVISDISYADWWNDLKIPLDYQGPLGDYPRQYPYINIHKLFDSVSRTYLNEPRLDICSEDGPGGSGAGVQIYFKEGQDGKWYMYDGWSVTGN